MRCIVLSVLVVGLVPAINRGDDAADARAIVEKAVKASGHKAGDKPSAMTWKDKGKFTAAGMAMAYEGDFAFEGPDKYRMVVGANVEGMKLTFTVVANGTKAWESALGQTREVAEEKLDYILSQTYANHVTSLLPLLADKEFKLATDGEREINKKKALAVKVTREKRPAVVLCFDKDSGLLVKAESKVKDEFQAWKEVTDEVYYDGYKDVGGKKYFFKMKVVRDGKTMLESDIVEQKAHDKLDAKLFEKP